MSEPTYMTSPVGRFIMGDAFTGSDKDHQGRPRLDQKGQPKTQWFMGVAFQKNDPAWPEMWNAIATQAATDFPGGETGRPDFAWKVVDGDTKYPDRDECRGCYIVRFSSGFAPSVFDEHNGQIPDTSLGKPKRGDFVQIYFSIKGNGDRMKPGVYLNHSMVKFAAFGEAISSGPSADQAFGAAPTALPPGASMMPHAPASGMPAAPAPMGGAPAYPQQPGMNPAPTPPAPAGMPTPAPVGAPAQPTASHGDVQPAPAQVQPAPDFVNGPAQPGQGPVQ